MNRETASQAIQIALQHHKALSTEPGYAEAYSNLLFLYAHQALLDPHKYLAQARGWEQACVPAQDRQAARGRTFQRPPLAGRRLKIGCVSADYRHHPVSFNIEQVFAQHGLARFELFAYSNHGQQDHNLRCARLGHVPGKRLTAYRQIWKNRAIC